MEQTSRGHGFNSRRVLGFFLLLSSVMCPLNRSLKRCNITVFPTGCVCESETNFEAIYLHEKCNFLSTLWYHWKALSMYFQNHTSISQLSWHMIYLCGNNWRYPIVYRAGFFVLFHLVTLNLTKMSTLEVKFNFNVKTNVLLCSGSKM